MWISLTMMLNCCRASRITSLVESELLTGSVLVWSGGEDGSEEGQTRSTYKYIYTSFKSSLYQEKSQWRHLTGSSSVCIENVHSVKITDTQSKLTTAKLLSPFPYTLRGIVLGSSFSFSSLIRLRAEKHDVRDFPLHTHYYTLHGDVWRWGLPFEEGEPLLFLFCWAVGT